MIIGIPKEIKAEENRVAITPAGVNALVAHGHRVLIERHAGAGSGLSDAQYRAAGAQVAAHGAAGVERRRDDPQGEGAAAREYRYLREGLLVFTYLHLAASGELTQDVARQEGRRHRLRDDPARRRLAAVAGADERGGGAVVHPGRQLVPAGAERRRGILLGGASGVRPANVVILGAGIAGANACQIAAGVGAHVSIIDRNPARLRYLHDILGGHITTVMSNRANIEEEVVAADLVVGSVLVAGAKAPHLVTRKMVRAMKPGAAIVDISIDQGGCVETSRPTTLDAPIYVADGVVHYCVTNMPAIVPRTSTFALTNATLSYALELADKGLHRAVRENIPLQRGVNVLDGHVTHAGVAEAFQITYTPIGELI